MVMIAAASVLVVGARWAPPLLASVVALTMVLQVPITRNFVDVVYVGASIEHRLAPVVYQDWADDLRWDARTITIDAGCPVEAIGIGFMDTSLGTDVGAVPATVVVATPTGTIVARGGSSLYDIPTYRLESPASGPITVELPEGAVVRRVEGDRDPSTGFGEVGDGDPTANDPVATAFCPVPDPDTAAFERIYPIGHPEWVGLGTLRAAPVAVAAVAVAVAALLLAVAVRDQLRSRRRAVPSGQPADP
jgi:hypothetical protein